MGHQVASVSPQGQLAAVGQSAALVLTAPAWRTGASVQPSPSDARLAAAEELGFSSAEMELPALHRQPQAFPRLRIPWERTLQ